MSTLTSLPTVTELALSRLEAWLDTMRGLEGYGGPVAHWWQQGLVYTGTGRDWRYEGIIIGYSQLWQRTGEERWLRKAKRAGNDLVTGQLADGHFAASAFELNPASAGTPHEAAADVGLLYLARALHHCGDADWATYLACAERNLHRFYLDQLWDEETRSFRDSPRAASFVPNKAATACDALFLLAEITGEPAWVERYALPTLDRLLTHQVRGNGRLDGAIAQNSSGERRVEKYFPLYIARCVPALLSGYRWTDEQRYAEGALRAMRFIARYVHPDGSLPAVVYANKQVNRYPGWIAACGDVLRAAEELRPLGFDADFAAIERRLLGGQDATGGVQTASGFGAQAGGRPGTLPDLRDVLRVVGWCDKAFRYWSGQIGGTLPVGKSACLETECVFQGRTLLLTEAPDLLEAREARASVRYRWRKGQPWPELASPDFWLR